MCKQMGTEPDPEQIPPEREDFSDDFQICFDILGSLSPKWESMAGVYLGRDFSTIEPIFNMYGVDKSLRLDYFTILKLIDAETAEITNAKLEAKRKHGK